MSIEPEAAGCNSEISRYTAEIVAAYVAKNHIPHSDVPALIAVVQGALSGLLFGASSTDAGAGRSRLTQAEISKSITRDFLISFIDGKPYKTLKRHLRNNGFDPYSYRAKFGLPSDYPMVAAVYSVRRSEISRNREHWTRKQP